MSFDREDCFDECKMYVRNCDFLFFLQDLIFDSFYTDKLNTIELIKLYEFILNDIEVYEKQKYGRILDDYYKFREDIEKLKEREKEERDLE